MRIGDILIIAFVGVLLAVILDRLSHALRRRR